MNTVKKTVNSNYFMPMKMSERWRGTGILCFNVWNASPQAANVLKQYGSPLLPLLQALSKVRRPCRRSACNMHNVCRILSGHLELSLFLCSGKTKKSCDMFIKQQGSYYCAQQSLSQCSHIVACTCSLGTVRLIVSLLSVMQFILSSFLLQLVFSLVCSLQVARMYHAIFRMSSMFVKYFKIHFHPSYQDLLIHS